MIILCKEKPPNQAHIPQQVTLEEIPPSSHAHHLPLNLAALANGVPRHEDLEG